MALSSAVTALDVVFHHATYLRQFYPRWVNHAMCTRALKNEGVGRAAENTFLEKGWSQIQIGTAIAACATQH
jgi:hypothetical protein